MPAGLNVYSWNREQAIVAARRSVAVRQAKALLRHQAREHTRRSLAVDNPQADAIERQLGEVRQLIADTRLTLIPQRKVGRCSECDRPFGIDGKERAALIKALVELDQRERILLGIPLPGTLKPSNGSKGAGPNGLSGRSTPGSFRVINMAPAQVLNTQPLNTQPYNTPASDVAATRPAPSSPPTSYAPQSGTQPIPPTPAAADNKSTHSGTAQESAASLSPSSPVSAEPQPPPAGASTPDAAP